MAYVPLSKRGRDDSDYDALYDGVPLWLTGTLIGWVRVPNSRGVAPAQIARSVCMASDWVRVRCRWTQWSVPVTEICLLVIRLAVFEDVEIISEIELRAGELFRPAAFIIATTVDDCAHVMQVSVVPERRGERLGAALINQVESWATFQG